MLDAQVAFPGVPYDGGTPEPGLATGQRAGPAAAREASGATSRVATWIVTHFLSEIFDRPR